jgi:ubiquinol-cytochrome c reductase subunit 7
MEKVASFVSRTVSRYPGLQEWYRNAAGYRKFGMLWECCRRFFANCCSGLHHEDLLVETNDVQAALARLSTKEQLDRSRRIQRAMTLSASHKLLPEDQWVTAEQDAVKYLQPHLDVVLREAADKDAFDKL